MPSEQHLPYRSVADVVVLDGDGSRWVREQNGFSPKNGGSSPIASRNTELARRLMVKELRHAATGAYRHVYSLDVIAGAIGVDAEGKNEHEIEREVYARLADIIEGSVSALTGQRRRTRKVEAYCVVDYGGSFAGAWENPVRAFTDYGMAKACKRVREQRRIDPGDEVFCQCDYIGTYIKNIEAVFDE